VQKLYRPCENLDAELKSFGLGNPATIHHNYDVSGSLGGPIKKDRLWFFGTVRTFGAAQDIPGLYGNANAGNLAAWTYVPDTNITDRNAQSETIFSGRITAQVTPKNKIGVYIDHQLNCFQAAYSQDAADACRPAGSDWLATGAFGSFQSPESFSQYQDTYPHILQIMRTGESIDQKRDTHYKYRSYSAECIDSRRLMDLHLIEP